MRHFVGDGIHSDSIDVEEIIVEPPQITEEIGRRKDRINNAFMQASCELVDSLQVKSMNQRDSLGLGLGLGSEALNTHHIMTDQSVMPRDVN